MIAELTNEEIVTRLLTSNEIISPDKNSDYIINSEENNLGNFLKNNKERTTKVDSKYSFIDLNGLWNF